MINTIIFDFGAIFINLDKQAARTAFKKLGLSHWNPALQDLHTQFETGKIYKETFLTTLQNHIPDASSTEIKKAWNAVLLDFPLYS